MVLGDGDSSTFQQKLGIRTEPHRMSHPQPSIHLGDRGKICWSRMCVVPFPVRNYSES
jgi:hypothetical protein